jgi:hypothetical protein
VSEEALVEETLVELVGEAVAAVTLVEAEGEVAAV